MSSGILANFREAYGFRREVFILVSTEIAPIGRVTAIALAFNSSMTPRGHHFGPERVSILSSTESFDYFSLVAGECCRMVVYQRKPNSVLNIRLARLQTLAKNSTIASLQTKQPFAVQRCRECARTLASSPYFFVETTNFFFCRNTRVVVRRSCFKSLLRHYLQHGLIGVMPQRSR